VDQGAAAADFRGGCLPRHGAQHLLRRAAYSSLVRPPSGSGERCGSPRGHGRRCARTAFRLVK
ncbi:unnamed protein product, partial [Ascophyllum nodosum]